MYRVFFHIYQNAVNKYKSEGVISLIKLAPYFALYNLITKRQRFVYCTSYRYHIQKHRYSAPAKPYKPIWVNPKRITRKGSGIRRDLGLGQIRNGDWYLPENSQPLDELPRYLGLKQRFEEGRDWEDTAYYSHVKSKFDEQNTVNGYRSFEEFKNIRLAFVDELFMNIRDNGYQPNFEAGHNLPDQDGRPISYSHLEPLVVVGKDGAILLDDGRHRVAIAEILGIESIPVNVLARHSDWQTIRDTISDSDGYRDLTEDIYKHMEHPDIKQIVDDSDQTHLSR